ncbi:MAG: DUF192 domain-containing protein [Nitrospirae bacterium]|nr:DUF192 domain-containing protein [Nitrospirota bacterium]
MKKVRIGWVSLLMVFLWTAPNPGVAGETDALISVQFPSGKRISAETADTLPERTRGLMFREALAENQGMLFIYDKDDFYGIWMKNCLIPLDILWMDGQGRVLYLEERVPPCRTEHCPIYTPPQMSRYILEIHEGLIQKERLRPGSRLLFFTSGPEPKAILPSP